MQGAWVVRSGVALVVACGVIMSGASPAFGAEESQQGGASLPFVSGMLDGKTFVGEIGEQGNASGDKDELIFRDGTFHPTACDPYGFGDGAYTATASGDVITFEAETISPTDGTLKWQGTVRGDMLEGTSIWYRPGKEPVEHWMKGQIQQTG